MQVPGPCCARTSCSPWLSDKPRPLYEFVDRHFRRPRESRSAGQSDSSATETIRSRMATLSPTHKKSTPAMVCPTATARRRADAVYGVGTCLHVRAGIVLTDSQDGDGDVMLD